MNSSYWCGWTHAQSYGSLAIWWSWFLIRRNRLFAFSGDGCGSKTMYIQPFSLPISRSLLHHPTLRFCLVGGEGIFWNLCVWFNFQEGKGVKSLIFLFLLSLSILGGLREEEVKINKKLFKIFLLSSIEQNISLWIAHLIEGWTPAISLVSSQVLLQKIPHSGVV